MKPDELRELIDKTTARINELNKNLTNIYSLRYKALIHGLVKKGLVNVSDLARVTGLNERNVYRIVEEVDKLIIENEEI